MKNNESTEKHDVVGDYLWVLVFGLLLGGFASWCAWTYPVRMQLDELKAELVSRHYAIYVTDGKTIGFLWNNNGGYPCK